MTKLENTDEQDAKAFRAVFLNGEPLVPPTLTAPCDVIGVAMQRLHALRARVSAGGNRPACEARAVGAMNSVGGA